ncbi:DUF605-domain-containing protein [Ramicandelaber brevisporus]|nr:DUF605-domain-containing protein [Ramicandelaber brevisporus]
MTDVPDELLAIRPHLQRSAELVAYKPEISYYCKYYAVKRGMQLQHLSPEGEGFLHKLMDELVSMKAQYRDHQAVTDEQLGAQAVEDFAMAVFDKADSAERSGEISRDLARNFAAAVSFLEVTQLFSPVATPSPSPDEGDATAAAPAIRQMGELRPDIAEKIKYAKWKMVTVAKTLRESGTNTGLPVSTKPKDPATLSAQIASYNAKWSDENEQPDYSDEPEFLIDPIAVGKATKHAKWALSALNFDDAKTAIKELQNAIDTLLPYDKE